MSGIKEMTEELRKNLDDSKKEFEKRYKWRIDNVKKKLIEDFLEMFKRIENEMMLELKEGTWNDDIKNKTKEAKYWKGYRYGLQAFWGDFVFPEKEELEKLLKELTPSKPLYSNCWNCDRTIEHCVKNKCPHREDDVCTERVVLCPAIQKYYHEKEPTDSLCTTAIIKQIIEIYDNGHEHVFEPEKYKVVSMTDLEDINLLIRNWNYYGNSLDRLKTKFNKIYKKETRTEK